VDPDLKMTPNRNFMYSTAGHSPWRVGDIKKFNNKVIYFWSSKSRIGILNNQKNLYPESGFNEHESLTLVYYYFRD
jgi:hypothetical protein